VRYDFAYLRNPRWDTGRPPKELVELVENGSIKPCRSIDLGCGRGHAVRYLISKGFDAWGIDLSSLSIRQAKKTSKSQEMAANFIKADVLSYVPENKFSLVTDIGFYHIFPENIRKHLVDRIYKHYLRKGGRILLWCMDTRVSKAELLSFFSDKWKILEIQKTDIRHSIRPRYYFLHARARAGVPTFAGIKQKPPRSEPSSGKNP